MEAVSELLCWLRLRVSGRKRDLELLEKLPLGPQHSVQLVRVFDRVLALAVSPGGCTLLATREDAAP